MSFMETLSRIGPLVPTLLLLGAALSLFEMFSLALWVIGILSLIFATVIFGIQLIELPPTWALSGLILLVSAIFLACAYVWALPTGDELLVIHPSGIPLILSFIWFVFAATTVFRTLKQRALSAL